LAQQEAKRLLAYSAIAHAGYLALGLFGPAPAPAIGYYLLVYALSTGLALAVLSQIDAGGGVPYAALSGLIKRSPLLAGLWLLALFSLAGLPPLAGFWGKYLVFLEAARGGAWGLLAFALLTAVVAAYYYLRLAALAFFARPEASEEVEVGPLAAFTLGLVGALVLVLGVFPGLLMPLLR
jgi:NADH-quinone oxidoreductase subunit N